MLEAAGGLAVNTLQPLPTQPNLIEWCMHACMDAGRAGGGHRGAEEGDGAAELGERFATLVAKAAIHCKHCRHSKSTASIASTAKPH